MNVKPIPRGWLPKLKKNYHDVKNSSFSVIIFRWLPYSMSFVDSHNVIAFLSKRILLSLLLVLQFLYK